MLGPARTVLTLRFLTSKYVLDQTMCVIKAKSGDLVVHTFILRWTLHVPYGDAILNLKKVS